MEFFTDIHYLYDIELINQRLIIMSVNIDYLLKAAMAEKEEPSIDPLFLPRNISGYNNTTTLKEVFNPQRGNRASSKYDNFYDWDDDKVITFLNDNCFIHHRKLGDGSWVAIMRLAFTWSVCTDITPMSPYAYRWCFENIDEALYFIDTIKEFDEVPTRRDSLRGHRFHDGQARYVKYDELGFKMW